MEDNRKFFKASLSSYLSRFWSLISNFIFVPIYIQLLGMELYGIVIIAASVNVIVAIADAGISPGIIKFTSQTNKDKAQGIALAFERKLLVYLTKISWLVVVGWGLLSFYLSKSDVLSSSWVTAALIILSSVLHLFTTFYRSALIGREEHEKSNYSHLLYSILRNGAVCIAIYYVHDVDVFFAWQLGASILYIVYGRYNLGLFNISKMELLPLPKEASDFSKKLLLVSLMGVYLNNLDKFMIGGNSSFTDVGVYGGMFVLSQASFVLCMPLIATLYPSINKLLSQEGKCLLDNSKLLLLYKVTIAINTFITAILCLFFSEIFSLWTGTELDKNQEFAGIILVLGGYLSAGHLMFYHVALSRSFLTISKVVLSSSCILSTIYFTSLVNFEILYQVAYPWLITNLMLYLGYYFWVKKQEPEFFKLCRWAHFISHFVVIFLGVYFASR